MNRATPKMRDFAEHLVKHEAMQMSSSKALPLNGFPECEKLRPHLATLMGNAGFRALVMRALALAGSEVSWLNEVQVGPTNALSLSHELAEELKAKTIRKGRVMVLAQLLGLMVAFIGEKLTLQLLIDVWPKLPVKDFNFSKEDPS